MQTGDRTVVVRLLWQLVTHSSSSSRQSEGSGTCFLPLPRPRVGAAALDLDLDPMKLPPRRGREDLPAPNQSY
jgi:hypothetical protein